MGFKPKPTRKKIENTYKTIYISEELADKVDQMAKEYDTSFNNVVISAIEFSLNQSNFQKDE